MGFIADATKHIEAFLGGWSVVRLTEEQITTPIIERLIRRITQRAVVDIGTKVYAIHLPRPRHDHTLLSTSKLTRLLNIPESQMLKAIREGVIRPIGEIGRSTIIALTDDELDDLRRRFHPVSPENAPHRSVA